MAKKISDLPAAATFDGSEQVPLLQSGVNKRGFISSVLPPGYIDGLQLKWVGANALTVTSGAAYIPSLGRVVRLAADVAKSSIVLAANAWYHVYLWLNGANLDVEIVTTAPSEPYNGSARTKNGDASRRYLGSILADPSGSIFRFQQAGDSIRYATNVAVAPFYVLSGGSATTATTVSCSGAVPVTARFVTLLCLNSDAAGTVSLGNPDMLPALSATSYMAFVFTGSSALLDLAIDSSQRFNYVYSVAPTGRVHARVTGYVFQR